LNRNFYFYLSSYKDLSNQEFLFLKKTSLSYICFRCLYGHELIYSFDNALQRLSAASQDLFDDAVRLERIFLRYEPKVVSSDSCTYTGLVQDQIATQLLGQQWSDSTPMVVRGDCNCLFNAIFLVLFGHENASSEIRLKTFFELFDNAAFYERIHVKSFTPDISPPLC
jgi:hypothetical protein